MSELVLIIIYCRKIPVESLFKNTMKDIVCSRHCSSFKHTWYQCLLTSGEMSNFLVGLKLCFQSICLRLDCRLLSTNNALSVHCVSTEVVSVSMSYA